MLSLDVHLRRGSFERRVSIKDDARIIALDGRSGVGKTTVLHAIAGLLRPLSGRIEISDRCLYDSALGIDVPPYKRRIGYVFQDTRLFPHLNVRDNLRYGHRSAHTPVTFSLDVVASLLGIELLLARRITNLSGGEIQRVALGRALLSQPALLLLDEPLSMLDQARREELIPYLQRIRDDLVLPIIYVSHSAGEINQLTDAVHVLE